MTKPESGEDENATDAPQTLKIGIRQFVAQALQQGDLRHTLEPGPTAVEGLRAHQRLQKKRETGVEAEFRVQHAHEFEVDGQPVMLQFSGRVDLLYPAHLPPLIEEIKSTYVLPDPAEESPDSLHWAQAKLYAWCYAEQQALEAVTVRVTWVQVPKGTICFDEEIFQRDALLAWLQPAVEGYLRWLREVETRRQAMVASARALTFPYGEFRPGQRGLAAAVYRTLRDHDVLLAEAPTGIGKTMSVLFPAIKNLGEQHIDKILYLTAKRTGREVALDAVAHMQAQGLHISVLELRAKQQTCACLSGRLSETALAGCEQCPHTLGFFNRLPDAMRALWESETMHADRVAEVADTHGVCAFELSLRMIPWAALVIGDYNYLYDPLVRLAYFDETSDRIAALVDEAHNLPDRARGMYSGVLEARTLSPLLRRKGASPMKRALNALKKRIQAEDQPPVADTPDIRTIRACEKVVMAAADASASFQRFDPDGGVDGAMTDCLKMIFRYLKIAELYAERHRTLTQSAPATIELACLNAQHWLTKLNKPLAAKVFFSATLRPSAFYRAELGLESPKELSLPSPFPPQNQCVLVAPWIDTRYAYREAQVPAICALIEQVCQTRPGKYLVFFSSYAYMNQVFQYFSAQFPGTDCCIQEPDMDDNARQAFLAQFFEDHEPLVGFVISGGIFAEGVDFKGDALHGAICIGPALPQMDTLKRLIRDDYVLHGENGFNSACVYPGFTRVQQSAGRVIRSETDQGVMVLVDQRFASYDYRKLFPSYWQPQFLPAIDELAAVLRRFWQRTERAVSCESEP